MSLNGGHGQVTLGGAKNVEGSEILHTGNAGFCLISVSPNSFDDQTRTVFSIEYTLSEESTGIT